MMGEIRIIISTNVIIGGKIVIRSREILDPADTSGGPIPLQICIL